MQAATDGKSSAARYIIGRGSTKITPERVYSE
jgi:hypothetical protein